MKCKVRFTRTVEMYVEGEDEAAILDWMYQTTPEQAYLLADGDVEETYNEEIICPIRDDCEVNYTIQND